MNNKILRAALCVFVLFALLSGCASTAQVVRNDNDPLERYNRAMFTFNDKVDKAIVKPIAQGYQAITPDFVDRGISNFFSNLNDLVVIANDLLQLKLEQAVADTNRVAINSTLGLLGFIDIATLAGLPKNNEDFGQTLGYWGVGEGVYIVLPLLGPTTTRDVWSYPVDYFFNPVSYVDPTSAQAGLRGVDIIDTRADLLQAERALGEAALDPYTFQRETYLQRRRNLVSDGEQSESEDELFEELEEPEAQPPEG
jgi:phospholipid-binding lipoprotein MlaA